MTYCLPALTVPDRFIHLINRLGFQMKYRLIYFTYFILGTSNQQVGVSKCLPNTAPRNNTVLAQALMKSKE